MYSTRWTSLFFGLLLLLPSPLCIPMPDAIETDQESELEKSRAKEVATSLPGETQSDELNPKVAEAESLTQMEQQPKEYANSMDETAGPAEAETEKPEQSKANKNEVNEENEIAPAEEKELVTEKHFEIEAEPTEFVEEAVTSPRKPASEEDQVGESATTEQPNKPTTERKSDGKTITRLLGQLLHKLNARPVAWNDYQYITALKNSDGSVYLPKSHRQSTRKHLATLLGFAEEIVLSKNALANVDWSNGATIAVPQPSQNVEKKSPSEERTLGTHESKDNQFSQTAGEASEKLNEPHTNAQQPEEMNTKHETPNPSINTGNLVTEPSAEPDAESQKKEEEAEEKVKISSMEPLILVGTDKPVESVKTEENLTSEMEENQPSEGTI